MPTAVVVHHNLNAIGGATRVAIEIIEVLHELGYQVVLLTVQPPNLERIASAYDKEEIYINDVRSILPFKADYLGIYQKLLIAFIGRFYLRNVEAEIVINTIGDTVPQFEFNCKKLDPPVNITYMHFPTFLLTSEEYRNVKYQKSFFWRTYFKPYVVATKHLFKHYKTDHRNTALTNSLFSKVAFERALSKISIDLGVLYPPVDLKRFSSVLAAKTEKKKIKRSGAPFQVLVISRFSPEKQIENGIRVARILIKEMRRDVCFEIVGALNAGNQIYFRSVQKLIENDIDLAGRVILGPNITNKELLDVMSKSDLYLHTMIGEHFGVAVLEAMAAGIVPIVPRYGGCSEIVPREFQYTTVEDAADLISRVIERDHDVLIENKDGRDSDATTNNDLSIFFRKQATRFSSEQFKKEMKQHIEQALQMKRQHDHHV